MRFGTRIFIYYVVIFIVCFSYPISWILDNLRIRYLEGVEDPLVDQANILAAIVGYQMEVHKFKPDELSKIFNNAYSRTLSAKIYGFQKTKVDMQVYVTDKSGKVIFDSEDKSRVGQDYLHWRDVRLTLAGKYGARTTKKNLNDATSSVLYVAAPVFVKGKIAGVLTVSKPTTTINALLASAKPHFLKVVGISAAAAVLLSYFISGWMARPIKRLTNYAHDVRGGRRSPFPKLTKDEIGEMGRAFEKMRETLEGKNYIEEYVQTLTHEIKSPLSAIRGAAELLQENMEPSQQSRFLANITNETNRVQKIVDKMLELSAIENLKNLEKREKISFLSLVEKVIESEQSLISKKKLAVSCLIPPDIVVEGEPFLLHQAVSNLVLNAIDFSLSGGRIELKGEVKEKKFLFTVRDYGPGIPDFAKSRIFDKFYSLQRPDTGKKSTGLGLNFVKAVAVLHKGEIALDNCPDKGARATLILPY
jgi:two-component system sensor histidine kinase CreC